MKEKSIRGPSFGYVRRKWNNIFLSEISKSCSANFLPTFRKINLMNFTSKFQSFSSLFLECWISGYFHWISKLYHLPTSSFYSKQNIRSFYKIENPIQDKWIFSALIYRFFFFDLESSNFWTIAAFIPLQKLPYLADQCSFFHVTINFLLWDTITIRKTISIRL